MTSLLLVLALALLGLQSEGSIAQPRGIEGAVVQQVQHQVLSLRAVETKPFARKIQQPFAPHLVCSHAQVLAPEFRLYTLRTLQAQEMGGATLQFGDLRGRAPPLVNQA